MKWFRILFLTFFLSAVIAIIALESAPGKQLVERFLLRSLEKTGLNVEAATLHGNLPTHFHLKNVVFEGIQFDEVEIEINPIYLLKNELYIKSLKAKGFHVVEKSGEESTFAQIPLTITVHSFEIQGDTTLKGSGKLTKEGWGTLDVTATHETLEIHGKAEGYLDAFSGHLNGHFQDFKFQSNFKKNKEFHLDHIIIANNEMKAEGTAELIQIPTGLRAKANLEVNGSSIEKATVSIEGLYAGGIFTGTTKIDGQALNEDWIATSSITLKPNSSLTLDNIQIQSDLLKANGNIATTLPEMSLIGKFTIEQGELGLLNRAKSSLALLYGSVAGTVWFDPNGVYADLELKQIHYNQAYIEAATVTKESDQITIQSSNLHWKTLSLDTATFEWNRQNFSFATTGTLNDPLDIQLNGTISDTNQVTLNALNGTVFQQQLTLNHPATFTWKDPYFSTTPLSLKFGDGSLFFEYNQTPHKTDIVLNLNNAPLAILSLNPLEVPIGGKLTVTGSLHEENGLCAADLKARIDNGLISVEGIEQSLAIQGDLETTLEQGHLLSKSNITINQKPFLKFDVDVPMTLDTRPFKAHLLHDRNVDGQISLHGRIEEVIDFFNFGIHRIEGNVDCEMILDGKIDSPNLKGTCEITDGRYQNYFTGTELTDLTGTLIGHGKQLILEKLTAHDSLNGVCTATGLIELSPSHHFPFHFDVEFSELNILQLDLVTAEAEGKISINGDLNSAIAKGYTKIDHCDIAIPDKIPRSFPELQVVYKNAPHLAVKKPVEKKPYPLTLDLMVTAPEAIAINGRGLNSEWQGNFAIGGLYTNPEVNGKLELVQGEFAFAGKPFKLIEGSIAMHGKAYEMPLIDIAANTTEKGISITARIKGPVNSPQITFQSSPPLPLTAILSYMIFGKDLSDVSGLQALQLAGTIATVAGEGPDILEMTRKSLGVDRLQIVMTPSSLDEGADTISLEVGKVIFPGFLVAIRQGAEDDGPNISIEVDLTHGFTLGLESQQQLEQGKFSLNWNINY